MKSTDWILKHDLSLMFDAGGRLWRFRPETSAHGVQPVEANTDGTDLVITVTVPGIKPGDIDVQAHGDVLELRGIAPTAGTLACAVGLPLRADMNTIETAYADGTFEVRVPIRTAIEMPAVAAPAVERIAVAV
jgi:HSP20 family molecular chaperone IbpA